MNATADISPEYGLWLTLPLSREADYQSKPVVACPDAQVVVLAPQLSFPVAGAATDAHTGLSAGYYGEFFGPEFEGLDGKATARKLIEIYLRQPDALPQNLDGTYVVFLWDPRTRTGLLCNDHYASRPVCYAEQNGCFYFSPEPKGLAGLPGFHAETNEDALLMVLNHGHMLSGTTYYREVRYLDPGSMVRINRAGAQFSRHFEYVVNENSAGAESPEWSARLAEVMRAACRKRIRHMRDMVLPVSGGYDSRGLLAVIAQLTGTTPKTISWGTDEDTPDADANIGRQVARFFHTDHRFHRRDSSSYVADVEETIARVDAGSIDAVQHPSELQLMRFIRREMGTDYLIRGDEIFGFKGPADSEGEALARCGLRDLREYPDLIRLLNPARRAELQKKSQQGLEAVKAECPQRAPTPQKDFFHFHQKIRNFANRSNYYKLSVLEAANPWLDKDVVAFLKTLPAPCRVNKVLYRETLNAQFPELMRIPIAARNSLEDWSVVMQQQPAMQKFIRLHLLEQHNRFHELMNMERVREMVAAAFEGRKAEAASVTWMASAKSLLKDLSPALYDRVRSKAQGRGVVRVAVPVDSWIARMLLVKLWCDRLP